MHITGACMFHFYRLKQILTRFAINAANIRSYSQLNLVLLARLIFTEHQSSI